jgi:hypothetical protein
VRLCLIRAILDPPWDPAPPPLSPGRPGRLYTVTSAFTLAKVIRDRGEETDLVSRVHQARLDKLLAEQDLLHVGTDRIGG